VERRGLHEAERLEAPERAAVVGAQRVEPAIARADEDAPAAHVELRLTALVRLARAPRLRHELSRIHELEIVVRVPDEIRQLRVRAAAQRVAAEARERREAQRERGFPGADHGALAGGAGAAGAPPFSLAFAAICLSSSFRRSFETPPLPSPAAALSSWI